MAHPPDALPIEIAFATVPWGEDGSASLLLVGADGHLAAFSARDAGDGALEMGTALFEPGSLAGGPTALIRAMPHRPFDVGYATDLCAFGRGRANLARDILLTALDLRAYALTGKPEAPRGEPDDAPARDPILHLRPWSEPKPLVLSRLARFLPCVVPEAWSRLYPPPIAPPRPVDESAFEVLRLLVPKAAARDAGGSLDVDIAFRLRHWHADLKALLVPDGLPARGHANWCPEVRALYLAPGEAGLRRRQAGALYPALSAALVLDPGLRALVDAGRPFEPALAELCGKAVAAAGIARPLDPPRLRRLRGLDLPFEAVHLHLPQVLYAIAQLPLHLVPADPDAWRNFLELWPLVHGSYAFGLNDIETTLRGWPADWNIAPLLEDREDLQMADEVVGLMGDLEDMLQRAFAELGRAVGGPDGKVVDAGWIAQRAVLEGLPLIGAWRLQQCWHDGLGAFDEFLAYGDAVAWPAWFAPFTDTTGTTIRCLTTSRDLVAEGSRGTDDDGAPGLRHCVGGYVERCASGRSCVASISAPGAARDGKAARVRLSTVELVERDGGLRVAQHRGFRNGAPPREAERALASFLLAVEAGDAAVSPFGAEAPKQTADPPPERVFEAWRPYLRPAAARGGLAGLRERLRIELESGRSSPLSVAWDAA